MNLELIIGIIGLILAWLTFKYSFFSKPKEELQHLKIQFKTTQELSLEVQEKIALYIKEKNAGNKYIFQGVTFQDYLTLMQKTFSENLSDNLFLKFEKLNLTKPVIISMIKSLENQFSELQKIDLQMQLLNKK